METASLCLAATSARVLRLRVGRIGPSAARPAVRTGIEPPEPGPQRGHTGAGHERRVGEAFRSDRLLACQAVGCGLKECPGLVVADGHIQAVARDGQWCATDECADLAVGQGTGLVVARGGQPLAGGFGRTRLSAAPSSQFRAPLLRPCRCPDRWPEAVLEPVAVAVDRTTSQWCRRRSRIAGARTSSPKAWPHSRRAAVK